MQKIVAFMESTWSHIDANGSLSTNTVKIQDFIAPHILRESNSGIFQSMKIDI